MHAQQRILWGVHGLCMQVVFISCVVQNLSWEGCGQRGFTLHLASRAEFDSMSWLLFLWVCQSCGSSRLAVSGNAPLAPTYVMCTTACLL